MIPSERFSLTANCSGVCRFKNINITWKLYTEGLESNESVTVWHLNDSLKSLISTKINSRNIAFRQGKLLEGLSYRLTIDVRLPKGIHGWAAYQFKTVTAPSGGTCNGTQVHEGTFGIYLNIYCTGWKDKHRHLIYEFFQQMEDGSFHLLLYSAAPFGDVQIPKYDSGEVYIKVVIINSLAARAETSFTVKVSKQLQNDVIYLCLFILNVLAGDYWFVWELLCVIPALEFYSRSYRYMVSANGCEYFNTQKAVVSKRNCMVFEQILKIVLQETYEDRLDHIRVESVISWSLYWAFVFLFVRLEKMIYLIYSFTMPCYPDQSIGNAWEDNYVLADSPTNKCIPNPRMQPTVIQQKGPLKQESVKVAQSSFLIFFKY